MLKISVKRRFHGAHPRRVAAIEGPLALRLSFACRPFGIGRHLRLNKELRHAVLEIFDRLKSPEKHAELEEGYRAFLALRRNIDAPAFQPKAASSLLQFGDFCAFAIKL